jgi:hypothetical protein
MCKIIDIQDFEWDTFDDMESVAPFVPLQLKEEIVSIQKDIKKINNILKDMSRIVEDKSEMEGYIKDIETYIRSIEIDVDRVETDVINQLDNAVEYWKDSVKADIKAVNKLKEEFKHLSDSPYYKLYEFKNTK